ncbi:hypothetical protein BsWGS_14939 [Bradybaena similaris]
MVSEVVIGIVLLPALLFVMLMALALVSDTLHYGIDFCMKNQCGPGTYFFLLFLSTILQVVALPVYLMVIIIELVLHLILTVIQTISMGFIFLLGFPVGMFFLLMALVGCLYSCTLEVPMPDEAGG